MDPETVDRIAARVADAVLGVKGVSDVLCFENGEVYFKAQGQQYVLRSEACEYDL